MSTLRRILDVRPGERRSTFAAFAALFTITAGHTLLETARDALFLSKLPASQLPWMYLVIVVLALGLAQIRGADRKHAIAGALAGAAALTTGFWALAHDVESRAWVLQALYVWCGLFASWVMVQLWTLIGRVHTLTQAKRLYGFIGAGAVLGAVAGAFAARAALAFVAPRAMLLAASAAFVVAIMPVLAIAVPAERPPPVDGQGRRIKDLSTGGRLLQQNAFARHVLWIVLVATIAVTLADFLFKARIAAAFPDTHALAAWLSTFYAATNTLALVAQLVVGPWVFRALGVQRALFVFPLALVGAAGGVLGSGAALASAVLTKGLDGILRYSIHKTSVELLLVPVPDGTRERVKPIIELIGLRGGQALASMAILGLVALGASNPVAVGAIVFLLAVVWLVLVITIRGHYLDVFRETLRAGGLSGKVDLPPLDLAALEMLFAGLNSSHDVEVLASLELLAEQHREKLIPALILYHPSREVVLRALDLFAAHERVDFLPIADRLNAHPDREVAAAALRARTAVAPERQLLEERLSDECPQVAVTALVALIARGWISAAEADAKIDAALATRDWQTAAELARAIRTTASHDGEDPRAGARFDELLIRLAREAHLMQDGEPEPRPYAQSPSVFAASAPRPDVQVRLEVARAMEVRKKPEFLPVLVGMLARHELRATARTAIVEIPGALDFLDEVMAHRDFARDVRVHVPRTIVRFAPDVAARKLLALLLLEQDGAVRFKILRGLVKLRRSNPELLLEEDILRRAVEAALDHAEELQRWGIGLAAGDDVAKSEPADPLGAAHHLLVDLVRDKQAHAVQRLFMLLELLYAEGFEDIERGLRSKRPKTVASSLELVENIVRPPLRARVLALVGERTESAQEIPTYEGVLREILARGGATIRTLAEYRALELGLETAAFTGGSPSQPPTFESIGKRLVDRARELLSPEELPSRGGVACISVI